eukprot:6455038-Amphidinium_carterae.1
MRGDGTTPCRDSTCSVTRHNVNVCFCPCVVSGLFHFHSFASDFVNSAVLAVLAEQPFPYFAAISISRTGIGLKPPPALTHALQYSSVCLLASCPSALTKAILGCSTLMLRAEHPIMNSQAPII